MSQPKKKTSRSRRDKRRYASANAMKVTQGVVCKGCGEVIRPHTLCRKMTECSYYSGRGNTTSAQAS